MKFEFSQQILKKYSNIKSHENPSSGSLTVPCGQMDRWMNGWMRTTKLIVTFHSFVNMPKKNGTVISFEHK